MINAPILVPFRGSDTRFALSGAEMPHTVAKDPGPRANADAALGGSRPERSRLLIVDLARRQRTTRGNASNRLKGAHRPAKQEDKLQGRDGALGDEVEQFVVVVDPRQQQSPMSRYSAKPMPLSNTSIMTPPGSAQ
jgi:hypothetical protein